MKRNQFVQEIFQSTFALFIDELLEYDETIGEKPKALSDVYVEAFDKAAKASCEAAVLLETTFGERDFWD